MKNIKQIIDAVAVMVGRFLKLTPIKWEEAKIEAARMNEEYARAEGNAEYTYNLFDQAGEEVKVAPAMTPIRFMLAEILTWVGGIILMYLLVKILGVALIIVLRFAFILATLYAFSILSDFFFGKARTKDAPASDIPEGPIEPAAV